MFDNLAYCGWLFIGLRPTRRPSKRAWGVVYYDARSLWEGRRSLGVGGEFAFFFRFATKFFVKNPPAKIDSKFYLFLAKFNQERPKSSQNGAKRAQHGPQKGPNGAKRAQHWPKGRRKLIKKHKKNDARKKVGSRTLRAGRGTRLLEPFWPKRSPRGSILEVILVPFSIKNAVKNLNRNRASKKHDKT